MNDTSVGQWAEWKRHWTLVMAAFLGNSLIAAVFAAMGLFIGPLREEFGWSVTQVTSGASLASLVMIPLSPLVGVMIDRWGGRRIAIPGLFLTIGAVSALSLADGSPMQWLILWGILGLFGSLLNTTIWTYVIVGAFTAGRSMAMAVVLGGQTLAGAVAPPLAQWLTDGYGWRTAFLGFGAGWGTVALVLCVLFLRDVHRVRRPGANAGEVSRDLPGLTIRQAVRSIPLYRIAIATLIIMTLGSALLVHKAPILIEAGLPRADAAGLAALSGLAGFVGKFFTGWAMQKWDAGWVGGLSIGAMGIAMIFLLPQFTTPTTIVLAMMVVGFAGGAKLQIAAYLTSVYAGARNYGKIFGVMASMMAVGGGFGPVLGGLAYDAAGSYSLLIYIGVPLCLVGLALLVRLGAYPEWSLPPVDARPVPAGSSDGGTARAVGGSPATRLAAIKE